MILSKITPSKPMLQDTIVAITTPLGAGALAVIKMSGTHALEIAQLIMKPTHIKPRYASLRVLHNPQNQVLDEAIVIYFKAPHSYTAEDVIEFQCHGGSFIAQQLLDTLLSYKHTFPIRLAKPGEFTRRALLNGRIDITQAEAIAQMIHSKNTQSQHIIARQLQGSLKTFIDQQRTELIEFLANSEVNIDYSEEDLPSDLISSMLQKIDHKIFEFTRILEASIAYEQHRNTFKLSLLGKPNTGKSSLLNALLIRDRAIVSDTAGTTRDTIEEEFIVSGYPIRIIDTAGIRNTQDEIEQQGIKRSLESCKNSDIVVALFDITDAFDKNDQEVLDVITSLTHAHIIIAFNKTDQPTTINKDHFKAFKPLHISAKTGDIAPLLKEIENILQKQDQGNAMLLCSKRQIEAFKQTITQLQEAILPLKEGELELFSFHIQGALNALNDIIHPFYNEELLDIIFKKFCLGK